MIKRFFSSTTEIPDSVVDRAIAGRALEHAGGGGVARPARPAAEHVEQHDRDEDQQAQPTAANGQPAPAARHTREAAAGRSAAAAASVLHL